MKYWITGIVLAVVAQYVAAHSQIGGHSHEIVKTVNGGAGHEDCVRARKDYRVEYRFESSRPVEFSIHYHDRASEDHTHATYIVGPAMFESGPTDGAFNSDAFRVYCMVWTNKGDNSLQLTYDHSVLPPEH